MILSKMLVVAGVAAVGAAAGPALEAAAAAPGGIPRTVYMTHGKASKETDSYMERIREVNPSFEVVDFDDAAAEAFVRKNFKGTALPDVYKAVAGLGKPVMLADLFRLAVVAKEGGFYMDADMLAKAPLDDLVDGSPAVFPLEWWKSDEAFAERHEGAAPRDGLEHYQVGNYAFGAVAGHPLVLDALDEATERSRSLVAGRAGLRGLARRLFAAEGAAITDLEVLRTTGPYMLSEIYHGGRLSASPKYGDVELLRGDAAAPAAARGGANDWHKFGRFAEHTLAHTWVSRKLQADYGDYCDCGNTDPSCCHLDSVLGSCVDHCDGFGGDDWFSMCESFGEDEQMCLTDFNGDGPCCSFGSPGDAGGMCYFMATDAPASCLNDGTGGGGEWEAICETGDADDAATCAALGGDTNCCEWDAGQCWAQCHGDGGNWNDWFSMCESFGEDEQMCLTDFNGDGPCCSFGSPNDDGGMCYFMENDAPASCLNGGGGEPECDCGNTEDPFCCYVDHENTEGNDQACVDGCQPDCDCNNSENPFCCVLDGDQCYDSCSGGGGGGGGEPECDCGNTEDPFCCYIDHENTEGNDQACVDGCQPECDCNNSENPFCCVYDSVYDQCHDTCSGGGNYGGYGGGNEGGYGGYGGGVDYCDCSDYDCDCGDYDYGDCEDTNGDGRDAYGDGCEWYNVNGACGGYDDDDFYAHEMCCSCGGGSTGGSGDDDYCVGEDNTDWVSKKGEDCDWVFKKNEKKDWDKKKAKKNCKKKDDDGLKAKKACKQCACDKSSFKDGDDTGEASVEIIVPVVVVAVFLMAAAGWLVKRRTVKKNQHRRQSMPSALTPSSSRTIGAEQ